MMTTIQAATVAIMILLAVALHILASERDQ